MEPLTLENATLANATGVNSGVTPSTSVISIPGKEQAENKACGGEQAPDYFDRCIQELGLYPKPGGERHKRYRKVLKGVFLHGSDTGIATYNKVVEIDLPKRLVDWINGKQEEA